jgi:hypothetical protein
MTITYKLYPNDENGSSIKAIQKTEIVTGKSSSFELITSIPFDEANTDYQEYLTWKAEGNEPEAAG